MSYPSPRYNYLEIICDAYPARVLSVAFLYIAFALTIQAQTPAPNPQPAKGTQQPIPATQQAPLGSEQNAGAQQPPTTDQSTPPPQPQDARLDIYGFAMLDTGYNFGTIDPDWFDVVRPTKLPSFRDEFGRNGNWFAGVRQTRFGVKGYLPTKHGEIRTIFEFEMFGTGVDAGQTTFRLRHAWGEYRKIGESLYGSCSIPKPAESPLHELRAHC
jgi:hypothetical protein